MKHPSTDRFPLWAPLQVMLNQGGSLNWADLVLNQPRQLTTMFVLGSNPAVTWPNTPKVRRALDALDFLVVMDLFMTKTAERADIVLPAASFLEKWTLTTWTGWMLRRPIVEPLGECRSDANMVLELAKRMGYEQDFPWKDDLEYINWTLEPAGTTVEKILEEHPNGVIHAHCYPGWQGYKEKGFRTPSGKVEIYSSMVESVGQEALPYYEEPREGPISTPELFKKFPLIATTGTREFEYWHAQHHHLPELTRRNPEARAWISTDDAAKYGISDGDMIIIESKTGSLEIKAKVTEDIKTGMISVPHGWPDNSENMITSDQPSDPITGFPQYTGVLCRIRKKTPEQEVSKGHPNHQDTRREILNNKQEG